LTTSSSGNILKESQIYLKIKEFNNPLSVSQTGGLQIKTFDNLDSQIDESAVIPLIVQNPATIM
jgi:hypothetical protein|tara:strand:- start:926 stop:1117 length:192 start_codon:yes stop_codon:yes gene_type:complete